MPFPHVTIYTDGACSGNPGPGGWGVLLRFGSREKELSGGAGDTTNNRMELTAALEALRALTKPCQIDFYTDSEYLKNGITRWLAGWKRKGWKTSAKKPVKNQDLWQALDEAVQGHQISWHWVRGHAGQRENERVDQLARNAIGSQK
ncbi:MAG: ribonuclease HI [Chloroflexi bacterium]|jgi:ribonuclease HI|nr:ribonuclease HI [Chloroflexota bacterium]